MKSILYKSKSFLFYILLLTAFVSCEKHDFIDENVITGEIGPQSYWEVGSSTVTAGSNVPFVLQYYSTSSEIDHSEVWYSISETVSKLVACPWLATFTYSIASTTSEEKRISQKIKTFPHSLAEWSDSLHAYTFSADFPVSGTLSPYQWVKPNQFDEQKMKSYFGNDFMIQFKDSLYTMMKFADFKKMLLGMGLVDNFINYTDSTYDPNSDSYVFHFPKMTDGKTPVPDEIKKMFNTITFEQLIQNSSSNNYEVEYKRTYNIEAIMRVYDKKGVYGMTTFKKIDIN